MTGSSLDVPQLIFWLVAGLFTAFSVILLIRPVIAANGSATNRRLATAITWTVPAVSLALYVLLGRPDLTRWHTRPILPPFIAASVEKLTGDVQKNPTDIQGWILLGDVYDKIRRYDEAANAYRRAAELDPAAGSYKAMVGEMLVERNGGAVGNDAFGWFKQAPDEPLSRYYLALAASQSGDWNGAMEEWQALADTIPRDAPWRETIDRRIAEARTALGLDRH